MGPPSPGEEESSPLPLLWVPGPGCRTASGEAHPAAGSRSTGHITGVGLRRILSLALLMMLMIGDGI